jgi:glycosyltransferase involved in cell wall biosynthesis
VSAQGTAGGARAPLLLHVFATFAPAGPQVRTARVLSALGQRWRHAILAMDGRAEARELIDPAVELAILPAPPKSGTIATARRLRELLASTRPDLLLTYNFGAIDAALAASSLGFPPHVHHEDGFLPDEAQALKLRRTLLRRVALARAARVVVISENLRRIALERWKLDSERVLLIKNGIDLERFSPASCAPLRAAARAQLGLEPERFVFGAVGHLRPEKNYARLLAALTSVGGAALVIVGDGPERARLEALARSLGLAERVRFAGHRTDARPMYAAIDAFALSSDTEQLPISMLEAMACGRPVAATDVGDVRASLPEAARAYVVALDRRAEPIVQAELARALAALAGDPARARELGEACRAEACARFDERDMLRAYGELYEAASSVGARFGAAAGGPFPLATQAVDPPRRGPRMPGSPPERDPPA